MPPKGSNKVGRIVRTRQPARVALLTLSTAVVLSLATVAFAASGTPVVQPKGQVAGHGYAYWQKRFWQNLFASGRLAPKACQTLTVGKHRVALLGVGAAGPGPYSRRCNEPAGRPIYAQALTDECSNFSTDHSGFGTSAAQLRLCARKIFTAASVGVWVDGVPVKHFDRFITATGVYPVRVPTHNQFGIKRHHGRSAAYGTGLLLSGLAKGTHTIWVNGDIPSAHFHVAFTYTVQVR